MRLQEKVAIVTSAGAGIGLGIAERFAREGATVIIAELFGRIGGAGHQRSARNCFLRANGRCE